MPNTRDECVVSCSCAIVYLTIHHSTGTHSVFYLFLLLMELFRVSLLSNFAFTTIITVNIHMYLHFNNDNGRCRAYMFSSIWLFASTQSKRMCVCVFIAHKTDSFSVICFHHSVHLSLTEIMAFRFEKCTESVWKKQSIF